MRLTHFFIDRPIFATVISILIVLIGAVAYLRLPVTAYPEIAPPTIFIIANYPGASAEVVSDTVATPLEQEINGVDNMLYVRSESTSDGQLTMTITFELGTDLDQAQVLVQNRVAIAEPRLPEEVRRLGVQTLKASPDMMMVVHLFSPDGSRDALYLSNYARTQIVDRMLRIDAVGRTWMLGERAYSMRVWLDPERVAARNLTAGEVVAALRANNVQVASGAINQEPMPRASAFELNVETLGRLTEPAQFEDIVIRSDVDGRNVRVRDVGRVELAAQDYRINSYLDNSAAMALAVFQRPGSNALEGAEQVVALMEDLSASFPSGVEYDIVYNTTQFIQESVNAVYTTIFEAALLVVLVVVVFLQKLRASIIPIVAIPVSLIGTFALMAVFGFSLNNLSLLGLVLAIGIVVDDAIIVVENVERYIEEGLSPGEAAHKTMDEVSGALIAMGLVMQAVFLPAAFLEGITGQFFRQFALTIAAATAISVLVALTLSPALAALLLRGKQEEAASSRRQGPLGLVFSVFNWPFRVFAYGFNRVFERLSGGYGMLVRSTLRISVIMLVVYGGLMALTGYQFQRTPTGFIPDQDQGYLITIVQLPPGASLDRTDAVVRQATDMLLDVEGVAHAIAFAGLDGASFTLAPNSGTIFVTTEPFKERAETGVSNDDIIRDAMEQLASLTDANIFIVPPPAVSGIGATGGWRLYIQDERARGLQALEETVADIAREANAVDGLASVFSLFSTRTPKIFADIDRTRAQEYGVPPQRVFETLQVYLGSSYINDFNFIGRTFRVTAQADADFRNDEDDILDLRTRSDRGGIVPLGSIAKLEPTTGPYRVPRYNLFPAASLQGSTTPEFSTGQAIETMEALLEDRLPNGFGYEWTELALQETLAGDTAIYAFILAVVFVFLLLAALYESWLLPLSVILIVPMCLLAGITGVLLRDMDSNVLTQIGFVVLVGLASKNAILIVEFAKQAEDAGRSRIEAAVQAAQLRLRPILMTSFAFILGVVPLLIATGAGAELRQALGTAVFFGMLGVTFFGLIFTPVFYAVCRWIAAVIAERAKAEQVPKKVWS